jgi:mono/diheme cytochrome c family protein
MNDGLDKKITLGLALTLALLLAIGAYWLAEPSRQKDMTDSYKLAAAETFAQNCFFCHGDQGLGGIGPPLRETKLDEAGIRKTISRGVTIMPTWAREEGGTLNAFQIQQLADFILDWDEKLVIEAFVLRPPPGTANPPPKEVPPPPYAGMKNPFVWGDEKAVAMGQLLYDRMCARCHWAQPTDTTYVNATNRFIMTSALSQGLEEHPDFYFWRVSEGWLEFGRAMPPHKYYLPEKQRWQVLSYLWSMAREWEKVTTF